MKIHGAAILASLLLVDGIGCVHVGSSVAGEREVNGEAWYVKTTSFWGITFSTSVFYCPPSEASGPQSCVEAVLHDESQLAAVPAPAPETTGGVRPRDSAKKRKKAGQRDEDNAADDGDDDGKTEDRPPKDDDAADDESEIPTKASEPSSDELRPDN